MGVPPSVAGMTTLTHHLVRRALVVAAALVTASAIVPVAASAYGWPVKPFDRQHAVRGFFGDPRIDDANHSGSLHPGVDIVAPNGTPVYATIDGTAWIDSRHQRTVAVVASGLRRAPSRAAGGDSRTDRRPSRRSGRAPRALRRGR